MLYEVITHDHAMIIDERSQDERAKTEWAQRYIDERERVAYENQAGLAARIQQLEYELRSKDEAAARLNIQRESEAREPNARLRHWNVNRSDHGSMNSACSGSDNPESDVAMATTHPRTTEYNEGGGQKITSGIPTTCTHTGYDGSQTSAMPDHMYYSYNFV